MIYEQLYQTQLSSLSCNLACINRIVIESLLQHISSLHPLGEEAIYAIGQHFQPVSLAKNEWLLQEGQICRHLYFLEKGAIRGYYLLDGKEITHWFAFENDFVTSFHSFHTQQPAIENMQAMEPALLWKISRNSLLALMDAHREVERTVRIAYEQYYLRLEERFVNSQFNTAAMRYQQLLERSPQIIERVPLGYIASWLGISQETLSRIRSKQ